MKKLRAARKLANSDIAECSPSSTTVNDVLGVDDDDADGVNDVLGLDDDADGVNGVLGLDDDADGVNDVLRLDGGGGDSVVNDDNDDNDDGLAGVVADHVLPHRAYGFLFTTIYGHPDVEIIHPVPQLFDQLGQQPPVIPLRNTRLS